MDKKPIGPSFHDELLAHGGLIGQHFTWSAFGDIEFFEDTPPEVVAGVKAVYAAHDPTRKSSAQVLAARDEAVRATDDLVSRHQEETLFGDGKTTLTKEQAAQLGAYRKALRDLPSVAGFPNVDLPAAPDFIGV
jgi:hypothetical protein